MEARSACWPAIANSVTMRVGEIGFISPFRYTILIWAILLGIIVFGDIPDLLTIIGSVIVVLTGIYTFYRERSLANKSGGEVKASA